MPTSPISYWRKFNGICSTTASGPSKNSLSAFFILNMQGPLFFLSLIQCTLKKKTSSGTTENFLCTGSCEVPLRKQFITIIFQNGLLMAKWMWSNPARMGADLPRSISFIPVPGLVFCKPHRSLTFCHSGPMPLLCPSCLSLFWSLPFLLCGAFLAAVLCTTIIREIPMFQFRLAILMCCTLYWSRIVQARLLTC